MAKQIYIPKIGFKAAWVEEVGGGDDRVVYPGHSVDITLSREDFEDPESYHQVWIAITRAAQKKMVPMNNEKND